MFWHLFLVQSKSTNSWGVWPHVKTQILDGQIEGESYSDFRYIPMIDLVKQECNEYITHLYCSIVSKETYIYVKQIHIYQKETWACAIETYICVLYTYTYAIETYIYVYKIFFGFQLPWYNDDVEFWDVEVYHLFYWNTRTGRGSDKNRDKGNQKCFLEKGVLMGKMAILRGWFWCNPSFLVGKDLTLYGMVRKK